MSDADIWAELDAIFVLPKRMPGDIDVTQMIEHYGLTETGARNRMSQLVRSGEWEFVTVDDATSGLGKRKIVRRVR